MLTTDHERFQFLEILLRVHKDNPYQLRSDGNRWNTDHIHLSRMLNRYEDGRTTVLPLRQDGIIKWLVLAPDSKEMRQHADEVKRFICPSYAEDIIITQPFSKEKGKFGSLASTLFPHGCKIFDSPPSLEAVIWDKLVLWADLDERRPESFYEESEVSVFMLRNQFFQAIAARHFQQAHEHWNSLKTGRLLSDENIAFLKVHLLHAQGEWAELWHSEEFTLLCELDPLPRKTRAQLLEAFYHTQLAIWERERNFESAKAQFHLHRTRLGTLLRSQIGLDEELHLRVFAYEAAFLQDAEKLERYLKLTDQSETKTLIQFLLQGLSTTVVHRAEGVKAAEELFAQRLYEDAYLALRNCTPTIDSVRLLCGIAMMEEAIEIANEAANAYEQLIEEDQKELANDPVSKGWLHYVRSSILDIIPHSVQSEETPKNWAEWFRAFIDQSHNADQLRQALEQMGQNPDSLLPRKISVLDELVSHLISLALEEHRSSADKALLQLALPMFTTSLLEDKSYPDPTATDLYEYARLALCQQGKLNDDNTRFVLRLTEGLLLLDMSKAQFLWPEIEQWFNCTPTMRFARYVIESIELGIDFGVETGKLLYLWNQWVGSLINQIIHENKGYIQVWLRIGETLRADSQLLAGLADQPETEEIDPFAVLDGKVITIYSLRDKPAYRASHSIQLRNPRLRVRVCTADRLTDEAKAFARNSDIVILVTSCMSHALTYGIMPYINGKLLYPPSAGETGIIEVLEKYAYEELD